jgi:hypothetical protein
MSLQDQGRQASPHDVVGVGIAFSAAGLYIMLGAAGYLPMPESNSPVFISFCAGAAFLFAGLTCMVRARAAMTGTPTDAPDIAPLWAKASYRVLAIGAAGALATIGTWIAIGSGPRAFSIVVPLGEAQTVGEMVGRSVFALGVVIAMILAIALTVSTVRKLFDRAR